MSRLYARHNCTIDELFLAAVQHQPTAEILVPHVPLGCIVGPCRIYQPSNSDVDLKLRPAAFADHEATSDELQHSRRPCNSVASWNRRF
jgi:hypothetical protein